MWPLLGKARFSLKSDSHVAHLACIRAGLGIGFCQIEIAKKSKDLVRVLPKDFSFPLETWVVMHENLRLNPVCMKVFRALQEGLKVYMN